MSSMLRPDDESNDTHVMERDADAKVLERIT